MGSVLLSLVSFADEVTTEQQEITQTVSKTDLDKYKKLVDSGYKELYCKKVESIRESQGIAGLKNYNFSKALKYFNQALKLNPNGDEAYAYIAEILRFNGDAVKAEDYAKKAIKLNSNNVQANFTLGSLYVYTNVGEALKYLTNSISLDHNYISAYWNRGNIYKFQGEYEKAIEDFSKYLSVVPNNLIVHSLRGESYFYLEKYNKAMIDFDYILMNQPKNKGTLYYKAYCLSKTNHAQEALDLINKTVKLYSKDKVALIYRIIIYKNLNSDISLIKKDLQKIEQLSPNNAWEFGKLIWFYQDLNDWEKVHKYAQMYLELEPNEISPIRTNCNVLINLKQYEKLKNFVESKKNIIYDYNTTMYHYYCAIYKLGLAGRNNRELLKEAIKDLDIVLKEKDNPWLYCLRGNAKVFLGEYKSGYLDLQKHIDLSIKEKVKPDAQAFLNMLYACSATTDGIEKDKNGKVIGWGLPDWESYIDTSGTLYNYYDDKDDCNIINYMMFHGDCSKKKIIDVLSDLYLDKVKIADVYYIKNHFHPEQSSRIIVSPYINALGDKATTYINKNSIIAQIYSRYIDTALCSKYSDNSLYTDLSYDDISYFYDSIKLINPNEAIGLIYSVVTATQIANERPILQSNIYKGAIQYLKENNITYKNNTAKSIMKDSYKGLGNITLNDNDVKSAIDYYSSAIFYGFSKFDGYKCIGYMYYEKDNWFKACEYFTKALSIKQDIDLYYNRAYARIKMNDNSAALSDLTKVIGLNRNYSQAYWARATIYFDRKQWTLALADYKRYYALNKNDAAAVYNIGVSILNQGNKKAAYPYFNKAKNMYQAQGNAKCYNDCVRIMNRINGYAY